MAEETYGRGQVDWALWCSFARARFGAGDVPQILQIVVYGEIIVIRLNCAGGFLAILRYLDPLDVQERHRQSGDGYHEKPE